jgi:hypothetical protein
MRRSELEATPRRAWSRAPAAEIGIALHCASSLEAAG